jgi:zinc ribbon protein
MTMQFCDQCGLENRAGARFCARCGNSLSRDGAEDVSGAHEAEASREPDPTTKPVIQTRPGIRVQRPGGKVLGALVALGLIAILYAAYSAMASRAYSDAVGAHKRFDCSQAADKYGRLTGFYSFAITAHRGAAAERRSECRAVLHAENVAQDRNHRSASQLYAKVIEEHQNSPILDKLRERRAEELLSWGDSVLRHASADSDLLAVALKRYETVLSELPQTSETEAAKTRMVRLWASANSGGACSRADSMLVLATGEYISEEARAIKSRAAAKAPEYMLGCGNHLIADGKFRLASSLLRLLIRDFGGTGAARRAEGPLIDAEVGQARRGRTAALDEPAVSGSTGGTEASIAIENSSPYALEILFSGPSSRRFTIPRCSGCSKFSSGSEPTSCPSGPSRTFTVQPGAYSVVVRNVGRTVKPWAGDWRIDAGYRYDEGCFYVVTR